MSPAKCIVYVYLQDILGNDVGLNEEALFSVYGGQFKYNDITINQSSTSTSFDSNGYAQLQLVETETPGVYMNFGIKYRNGDSKRQINFLPVMIPNVGAVNLSTIANLKE